MLGNKLETHELITYRDIESMTDSYGYDAASTVRPVVSALGNMYIHLRRGEEYQYCDRNGITKTVSRDSFMDFMLEYFDIWMYCEATLFEFHSKLENHQTILYEDIDNLVKFCLRDKGALNAVINELHSLFVALRRRNERYAYYDKSGKLCSLSAGSFKDFVVDNFCYEMYDEVRRDYETGKYRRNK